MKLLIVTCLKEYQEEVAKIFESASIAAFSVTETVGYKDGVTPNIADSWFSLGQEHYDSVFLFSFTNEHNAKSAMGLIQAFNTNSKTEFPLRAFVMPVEASSYQI